MTEKSKDYAILGPPTENGRVAIVCNDSEKRIEIGEFRPVPQGKPLNLLGGDAVQLTARKNDSRFDMEYIYRQNRKKIEPEESKGPSTAATEAYRDGWDAIWGKPIGQA